jgi:multimeric flavodoxin WrbA
MKILGISGSPRSESESGVYKLVNTVLENTGCEYELISLHNKKIHGCTACLGCVKDNICKQKDDMTEMRKLIVDADAYVIGAANYFSTINAITHAFLERWYQFRHREGDILWGKLAVSVGVGGMNGRCVTEDMTKFFMYSFIEPITQIAGQGAPSCFTCGYGETCKVGAPVMMYGEGFKITPENTPDVSKKPETMKAATNAGKLLGERLHDNHNRQQVTRKMQQLMMEKFKSSM